MVMLAGGSANATSIPFDDSAISANDAAPQADLLANAGALPNWTIVTPDLLAGNAGQGQMILQVRDVPTTGTNSNRPRPTPTTGPVQVPEPGTLLLLLSGLAATVFLRRQWRPSQTRA
jgi:hypothetical protein